VYARVVTNLYVSAGIAIQLMAKEERGVAVAAMLLCKRFRLERKEGMMGGFCWLDRRRRGFGCELAQDRGIGQYRAQVTAQLRERGTGRRLLLPGDNLLHIQLQVFSSRDAIGNGTADEW
jgi:hypothetical protein